MMAVADLSSAHQEIAAAESLLQDRRILCQLAAELIDSTTPALPIEVLDSPLARHLIGTALSGGAPFRHSDLVGLSRLCGSSWPPVVDGSATPALLAPALAEIAARMADERLTADLRLLTSADGPAFAAVRETVLQGVELARRLDVALVDDLLPHVVLIGILDRASTGGLVSASSRDYPGLVFIAAPDSAFEVAEAIVHEGAHQKLFDIATTRAVLTAASADAPHFSPPWPPEGRRWPLEQTLAAAHAYAGLAQFADAVKNARHTPAPGPTSLLPYAAERTEILGSWLLAHGEHLGVDAHRLLEALHGQVVSAAPSLPSPPSPGERAAAARDSTRSLRRTLTGGRLLVGLRSNPPSLFYVDGRTAGTIPGR